MRGRIKLKLQQAEMRSRQKESQTAVTALSKLPRLRRQYMAMVLYSYQGFTVEEIAQKFSWDQAKVRRWLEAGNKLVSKPPNLKAS